VSTLTDRYVAAVARGIPASQRRDVELELLTSIADAIEDRVAAGEPFAAAERAVLTGMGDPARLAATYADRPQYLVGPVLFPDYLRMLVVLLAIILPIVATIDIILDVADGAGIGEIIGSTVVTMLMVGVQVAFWTTLVFAVLERVGETAGRPLIPWSLDSLPEVDSNRIATHQTVPSLVMLVLFAGFIVAQQVIPFIPGDDGDRVPGLNPDLWSFWLPVLLVLLLAEAVFELVKYRVGRWTPALAATNTVLNLVFAVPFATLALRGDLINPEVFARFDWPEGAEANSPVAVSLAIGIALACAWDAIDGWLQVRRVGERSAVKRLVPVL
jgi:hypothetical protein